jgi:hypothetical protein
MASNDEILGISGHFDLSDIQKSIDELIKGLDQIGVKTDVLSRRMNDAMNDIARSSEDAATKNKRAMDVLAQGVAEAKNALANYPEQLRLARNEADTTALATSRLEEQLKKLNNEFLNTNVGSDQYERLKQSIAGVEQQIQSNNAVHEKQLLTIQQMESGYNNLVAMYGVGTAAIGTNAIAHTAVAAATTAEAGAHVKNAEKIGAETEAIKENKTVKDYQAEEERKIAEAIEQEMAAYDRLIDKISQGKVNNEEYARSVEDIKARIAALRQEAQNIGLKYDDELEKVNTSNVVNGNLVSEGDVNVVNSLAQQYKVLMGEVGALQGALENLESVWTSTHGKQTEEQKKVTESVKETTQAEKELNEESSKDPSTFRQQWNTVTELNDRIRGLTSELHKYEEQYDKIAESPGFDAQSKKVKELEEEIAKLKKQIQEAKDELDNTSGAGSFFAKLKEGLTDFLTGSGRFQESLANMKVALSSLLGPFSSATASVATFTKALWSMAATPIGAVLSAIVLALQAVHMWFTKSAEGQRAFSKITAYLGSLLSSMTDIAIKVGKYLYHAFADTTGPLHQLGKGLVGLVINPLKTIAKTLSGVGQIAKGVIDLIASGANVAEAKRAVDQISKGWDDLKKAGSSAIDTLKSGWDTVAGAVTGAFKVGRDGMKAMWETDLGDLGGDMLRKAREAASLAEQQTEAEIKLSEAKRDEKKLDIEIAKEREKIYTLTGKAKDEQIELVKNMLKEKYQPQIEAQQKLLDIQKKRNGLHTMTLEQISKEREMQGQVYALQAQAAASTRMLTRMQQANLKTMANAGKKDARQQQAIDDAEARWDEIVRKNGLARAKMERDMEAQIADSTIEAMKDGEKKKIAERERAFKKQLEQLEEQRNAAVEAERKRQKDEYDAQEKVIKARGGKPVAWDDSMLDTEQIDKVNEYYEALRKLLVLKNEVEEEDQKDKEKQTNKNVYYQWIAQFGDYAMQKQAIEDKANDEIARLEKELSETVVEETRQRIQQEIDLVKAGAEAEAAELDKKFGKTARALGDLFADATKKTTVQIEKLIKKYQAFFKMKEGKKSPNELVEIFGFTNEEITELEKKLSTGEISIKEIKDRLEEWKKALADKSPWQSFKKEINDIQEEINNATEGKMELYGKLFENFGQYIKTTAQQLGDLGQSIGTIFGNDGGMQEASKAMNNMGTILEGIGQFAAGDKVGGVVGIVSGIAGLFSDDSSSKERERFQARLNEQLSTLNKSINDLTEQLRISYGIEALKNRDRINDLAKEQQEVAVEGIRNSTYGDYQKFVGNQFGRFFRDQWGDAFEAVYEMAQRYGLDVHDVDIQDGHNYASLVDILERNDIDAVAAVLEQLQEDRPDLWAAIAEFAHGNAKEYLEMLVETRKTVSEAEKETMERLTTTTENDVFTQFLDSLYELADGSKEVFKDIAENWQRMVNKMVINNVIGEQFRSKLQEWYKKLAQWNELVSNGYDVEVYNRAIQELQQEYVGYVNEAQESIKQLENLGIIKDPDKVNPDQQATYNSLEKWGYEQADDLINRVTALQIIDEHQYELMESSLAVIGNIEVGVEGINQGVAEIAASILATVEMQQLANSKLDQIISNTAPIGEIRDTLNKLYRDR